MTKVDFEGITRFLDRVKQKPHMYVVRSDVTSMESLIYGFNAGCHIMSGEINPLKHRDIIDQVKIDRGWHFSPVSVTVEMRKRGLSDEKIIEELLDIEIEAWRRIESLLSQQ